MFLAQQPLKRPRLLLEEEAIPHRYALDVASGAWVNAERESPRDDAKRKEYACDCPERHRLKLVHPSGVDGRRPFAPYFAHVHPGECAGVPGEGLVHSNSKHILREWMSQPDCSISFHMLGCRLCDCPYEERTFASAMYSIQLERRSVNGRWRYDCLLYDRASGAPVYALEMVATHWASTAKIEDTRANGIGIAEFRALDIVAAPPVAAGNYRLHNLSLERMGECRACHVRAREEAMLFQLEGERAAWATLEARMQAEYARVAEGHKRRFEAEAEARRRQRIIGTIRALPITTPLRIRAHVIVEHLGSAMAIVCTGLGRLGLSECRRHDDDILVATRNDRAVLLFDDTWSASAYERMHHSIRRVWKELDVPRRQVVAIRVDTVVQREEQILQAFHEATTAVVEFRDCLHAILMQVENEYQICACCGIAGHRCASCPHRPCTRCGRLGHLVEKCYARKHADGRRL